MTNSQLQKTLVGTWNLVAWYNETDSGERIYPLGPTATGYINYAEDGHVFVHMMGADRIPFATHDPFGGSQEEIVGAFNSHITYAGRYTCGDTQVTHHVTQASCPNWIGSDQVRDVTFTQSGLRLSAAGAVFQGQHVTAYVDWVRAKS